MLWPGHREYEHAYFLAWHAKYVRKTRVPVLLLDMCCVDINDFEALVIFIIIVIIIIVIIVTMINIITIILF